MVKQRQTEDALYNELNLAIARKIMAKRNGQTQKVEEYEEQIEQLQTTIMEHCNA